MPRNGDGSSDNGPMEGHEILHGTTGDDSLQHTKHAAPMPAAEHGDALPGMSGGGTAATVPVSINTGAEASMDSSSSSKKRTEPHHASPSRERSELDQKFTKLDSDEVDMSTAQTESQERGARAQRRSDALGDSKPAGQQDMDGVEEARQFGGHADVEELHGAATLEGDKSMSDKKQNGNGGVEVHDADKLQRSKAEKFGGVNLESEGQTRDKSMSKEGAAADKKQSGTNHEALESHGADKSKSMEDSAEKKQQQQQQHNGSEHGNGAVEAHDADKLQRSKAEKFGGVNLENEGQAAANGGNKHMEAENKNEAKHVAEDAAKHTTTTAAQNDDDRMDIDEKSEARVDAKEQQHDHQNEANKHHAGRKDSLGGDTKGNGNGNAPVEVHEADKLARSKAAKFGGVNLGDA